MRAVVWCGGSFGAAVVAGVVLRALRRRWLVATVVGTSMLPALRPGERVLVARTAPVLRVGDVVVVAAPDSVGPGARSDGPWLVKRIAGLPGDQASGGSAPVGTVIVLGDNGGYDSRHFGPLPRDRVVGVVRRRLPLPS